MSKLLKNDDIKEFCLKLIHSESNEELKKILKEYKLWEDKACWRFYGDASNNISTINNQAPDAEKALVEKLANSFDARLLLESRKRNIDPKDRKNSPQNISEGMEKFFYNDSEFNSFMSLENETAIFATNTGDEPCISVVDKGEGQTPNMVPDTFLSLGKENKEGVLFTQGRYNQGGSGALNFCKDGISIILTKRCPEINTESLENSNNWGLTVTRRYTAKERGLPEPCYVYLAPVKNKGEKSGILSFSCESLKLFPNKMVPYSKEIKYGSLLKLYGYKMQSAKTNIVIDFLYGMEVMMPDAIMPVRLHECREKFKEREGSKDFREQVTSLQGFSYRNSSNKALEEGFPQHGTIEFKGFSLEYDIYAFTVDYKKKGKGKHFASRRKKSFDQGIIFTLGGQHYGELKSDFFRRKNVGLDYIKNDLIVIVNCSSIDGDLKNEIFKTDKSSMKRTNETEALENELEDILSENAALLELKNKRRKDQINEKFENDKPFEELMEKVIKSNPGLAQLFNIGPRLSNPFGGEGTSQTDSDKKLEYLPSYFKFHKKLKEGEIYSRTANINKKMRYDFETNVQDDYFKRQKDRGNHSLEITIKKPSGNTLLLSKENITYRQDLNKGKWLVGVSVPEEAEKNDILMLKFKIDDDHENEWNLYSEVKILAPAKQKIHTPKPPKPGTGSGDNRKSGFEIPKVTWIEQSDWEQHDFNERSSLKIVRADTKIVNNKEIETWDFFLNKDNLYLEYELKFNKKKLDEQVILNKYKLAMIFFTLSLIDYFKTKKIQDIEDQVANLTSGISSVLLDVIDSVNDLSHIDI